MSLEMIDYYLCNTQEIIYRILNQVLHNPLFQKLEALWLALNRCIDNDYHLLILPMTSAEINYSTYHAHIGRLLLDRRFNMPGGIPLTVLALTDIDYSNSVLLSKYTQRAYVTVLSELLFDEEPLARKPYDFEENTHYDHFEWESPIFHIIKPSMMPLKLYLDCPTDNLNMSILTSRFIQCIKILLRDAIGRFDTINQFENYLQNWIHRYCSQTESTDRYPLASATISITEFANKNSYHCHISLQLHWQRYATKLILPFKFG